MNTGHNIEVAWMLLRLFQFNGNEKYYPLPIEDTTYDIQEISVNEKQWEYIDQGDGSVNLPDGSNLNVIIKINDK